MASTYTPIATTTLGSASSTVTFSSIPSTYTDLILVCSITSFSATGNVISAYVGNGSIDSGSNYSSTNLRGNGSAAASGRYSTSNLGMMIYAGSVGNGTGEANIIVNFQNYANTSVYKTSIARGNQPATLVDTTVALWRSTSAINIIQVNGGTASFGTGSTFTLYGIKAA